MDVKVYKDKYINIWVDWGDLSILHEMESKAVHKDEKGDW